MSPSQPAARPGDAVGEQSNESTMPSVWHWVERCVISLPVLSLGIALLGWLTYGFDLPSYDDWRDYESGQAGGLELDYLFTSANDTAYPVGKALDSIALRFLGGNAIAYQFVSMSVVLGSLLALQYRLLGLIASSRRVTIAAFGLTILMLQPGSYWGGTNLGYHQAVPLVAVLGILMLLVNESIDSRVLVVGLFVLSAISGFIYISGAFSNLVVLTATGFGAWYFRGDLQKRFRHASLALVVPTLTALVIQLRVILVVQQGIHRPDSPPAYPTDMDFWMYSLGKIGRSLFLPPVAAKFSLVVSVVAVIAVIAVLVNAAQSVPGRHDRTIGDVRAPLILMILAGTVFAYLALVAVGRTNLRPDGLSSLETFQYGFFRFHYFWLTLLWPWIFLVVVDRFVAAKVTRSELVQKIALTASIAAILFLTLVGAMAHFSSFRAKANVRLGELACTQDLRLGTSSVECTTIPAPLRPSESALDYAESRGATFLRTLPPEASISPSTNERVIDELDASQLLQSATVTNGAAALIPIDGEPYLEVTHTPDTNIVLTFDNVAALGECRRLELELAVVDPSDAERELDVIRLVFDPVDDVSGFTANNSTSLTRRADPGSISHLRFIGESATGFENQVQLDLTQKRGALAIKRVTALCAARHPSGFMSPSHGSRVSCDSQNVKFGGGDDGTWHVRAGSASLESDYFAKSSSTGTSIVVTGLPDDGSLVHLSLFHQQPGGNWQFIDKITYEACTG